MSSIDLASLIVPDYDAALRFFVGVLGFDVIEDVPSRTTDGRAKRWIVVRPPSGVTGLVLAQADGPQQQAAIGAQWAGRVGLFLRVDDFASMYARMQNAGVVFESAPRYEPYGTVVVFRDPMGNRWDLLGPPSA